MAKLAKYLFHIADLCMGCHACEVACKMEHNLPAGVNRVRIVTAGPTMIKGKLELKYQRICCMHCLDSYCIEACPSKAIRKRPDGIIMIDKSLCTGCRSCSAACPQRAIDFRPDSQTAEICDLCYSRLDEGKLPFCLKHCMSGALFFGTKEEFESLKYNIFASKGKRIE